MQLASALLAALLLISPLAAQDEAASAHSPYYEILIEAVYPEDRVSLMGWEARLRKHLDQLSEQTDDPASLDAIAQIETLVDMPRIDFAEDREVIGDWRVRSLQADGLGAYAYQYFPARIYQETQALVFDKNSGSQRHRGLMARAGSDVMLFVGALYYAYQEQRLYSAHMEPGTDPDRDYDEIAALYKIGDAHYLMVFAPKGERFRFYEMRR